MIRATLAEMALLDSLDVRKLVTDAVTIDALGNIHDQMAPNGPGDLAIVRAVPLYVVGAVVPWNFTQDMAT